MGYRGNIVHRVSAELYFPKLSQTDIIYHINFVDGYYLGLGGLLLVITLKFCVDRIKIAFHVATGSIQNVNDDLGSFNVLQKIDA